MSKLYGNFEGFPDVVVGAWLNDRTFAELRMGSSACDSGEALPRITTSGFADECSAASSLLTAVVGLPPVSTVERTTLWPPPAPPVLFTTVTAASAISVSVWAFVFV